MNRLSQFTVHKLFYGLLVLLTAAGLKYGYSRAGSEDLSWMLGPTASLVEWLTGAAFIKEPGIGYVSPTLQMAIVPACAGINFMIAAFCMTALTWLYAMKRRSFLPICIPAALATAYGVTLCTNSLRILLAIHLYAADIYAASVTPERIHRIAGIGVYFICLCLLYLSARKATFSRYFFGPQHRKHSGGSTINSLLVLLPPLLWYLAVALVMPVFNRAISKNPALFAEHAGFVLIVSFLLFVLMFAGVLCYKLLKSRQEPGKDL